MDTYTIGADTVIAGEQAIPVVWRGDVVVCGGGPGGLGAAITANRMGLKTVLLERLSYLGGMCSFGCGMPLGGAHPGYIANGGVASELFEKVEHAGPDSADFRLMGQFGNWYFHDSEYFKTMISELALKEKLNVRLYTMVTGAIMHGERRVAGVIAESKSGRQAFLAKTIIDATGDGDICAWAGASYEMGRETDGAMMAATVVFTVSGVDLREFFLYKSKDPDFAVALRRAAQDGVHVHEHDRLSVIVPGMRPDSLFCNLVRVRGVDGTKVEDLTAATLEAHARIGKILRFFRGYVPGAGNAYVSATGSELCVRESRRFLGEDYLSEKDVRTLRKRETVIARAAGPFDDSSRGQNSKNHELNQIDDKDWFDIPYGVQVPKGLDNVMIASRCFSCSYMALTGARGMGTMLALGQSAANAALLAVRDNVPFRDVNVSELQGMLRDQGVFLG